MYLAGHLAAAYLAGRVREIRVGLDEPAVSTGLYACLLGGGLFPDLVDKPYMYLGLSRFSRTWGHSLFAVLAIAVAWMGLRALGRRGARPFGWFLAGWTTHFAADFLDDLVAGVWYTGFLWSPWSFWPIFRADDLYWRFDPVLYACHECYTSLEFLVVGLALVALRRARDRSDYLEDFS